MRYSRILPLLLAAVLTLSLWPSTTAPESTVQGTDQASPTTVYPSLPACLTEDGEGMALCTWDAQIQGNGIGTDVVSGDCALTDDADVIALCMALHNTQNGIDSVSECNSILNTPEENSPGWSLEECYKAMQ